jgi:hypothetical protein
LVNTPTSARSLQLPSPRLPLISQLVFNFDDW